MTTPIMVPDASVLLKWALRSDDEDDQGSAVALKDAWLNGSCQLLVPSLWVYEVGNILGRKRPSQAAALLEAMVSFEMEEIRPAIYLNLVFHLMRRFKVSFYDAAYHGLAIHLDGTLVTADVKYVRKACRAGHVVRLDRWQQRHPH